MLRFYIIALLSLTTAFSLIFFKDSCLIALFSLSSAVLALFLCRQLLLLVALGTSVFWWCWHRKLFEGSMRLLMILMDIQPKFMCLNVPFIKHINIYYYHFSFISLFACWLLLFFIVEIGTFSFGVTDAEICG